MPQTENKKRKLLLLLMLIFSIAAGAVVYSLFFFKAPIEQKAEEKRELFPPAIIKATDGESAASVTVDWDSTGESDIYALFRSESGSDEFVLISDTLSQTRYDDSNIAQGVVYYYKVRSGNVTDWSDFSVAESGYAFLFAPRIEHISKGGYADKITIRWKSVKDAEKYALFRSRSFDGEYRMLSDTLKQSRYTDRDVKPGVDYYYKLKAKSRDMWSAFGRTESGYAYVKAAKLIASNGSADNAIKIWWDRVEGAQSYALYRSEDIRGEFSLIDDSLRGTAYIDRNIIPGKYYHYKIKTYQNSRWSGFGRSDRGFARLMPPLDVAAGDGNDTAGIMVSWKGVEHAKRYALYRSLKNAEDFILISDNIRKTTYFDKDVLKGVKYFYRLKAINELKSDYSRAEAGYTALLPPKRVLATDGSREKIIISWEKSANAKGYDLFRSIKPDVGYGLIRKNIKSDYYEDYDVESGKSYYYKLRATNGVFWSGYSDVESGYTDINIPAGLKASDGTHPYHIDLSWNEADAQNYRVFRAQKPADRYTPVSGLITDISFRDKNISHCTTYYYKIKGFKNGRWSDFSIPESGYGKCGAFVKTYAGSGRMGTKDSEDFNRPAGVAAAGKRVYVADTFNHQIRAIEPDGNVTIIAGSGEPGSEDGFKRSASFYMPTGITVGVSGNIYVAEVDNHLIRKVTPQGNVTTFAGSGSKGGKDGYKTDAEFNHPYMITADKDENLYVTEFGNNKIRKITKEGHVTTFAGSGEKGGRDGTAGYAQFDNPAGIVVDKELNIYVSDSNNNNIRKITPSGTVISFAGSGKRGGKDGKGVAASFDNPRGLAIDHKGNIFVADSGNHRIRMITPSGNVKTIAGSFKSGSRDGYGTDASFFSPMDICADDEGNIYVAGYHNHKIRKITISSSPKNLTSAD